MDENGFSLGERSRLFLTLDYELYGDGSGDVFKHIIQPMEKLLLVAKSHGVKFTIFFEYLEYLCLKHEWEKGNTMGYQSNPAEAMERQLKDALLAGHDVQLHIHPQWIGATYINGAWQIDKSKWRLASLETSEIKRLLSQGKEVLEALFQPIMPSYRCVAFRAGGYNAWPSGDIVSVLRELDFVLDSSVTPGAMTKGELSCFDYSVSPVDMGFWAIDSRLELPSETNKSGGALYELPVFTYPIKRYTKYLSLSRLKSLFQNRGSARNALVDKTGASSAEQQSKRGKIRSLFDYLTGTEWQTWDFCLFSKSMHSKFLTQSKKQTGRNAFVLIGHPKGLTSTSGFEFLLERVGDNYLSVTYQEFLR